MTGLNFSNFINSILLTICLEFLQILGAVNRAGARKVGCGLGVVLVGASGWLGSRHPGQGTAAEMVLVREGLAHRRPGSPLLFSGTVPAFSLTQS